MRHRGRGVTVTAARGRAGAASRSAGATLIRPAARTRTPSAPRRRCGCGGRCGRGRCRGRRRRGCGGCCGETLVRGPVPQRGVGRRERCCAWAAPRPWGSSSARPRGYHPAAPTVEARRAHAERVRVGACLGRAAAKRRATRPQRRREGERVLADRPSVLRRLTVASRRAQDHHARHRRHGAGQGGDTGDTSPGARFESLGRNTGETPPRARLRLLGSPIQRPLLGGGLPRPVRGGKELRFGVHAVDLAGGSAQRRHDRRGGRRNGVTSSAGVVTGSAGVGATASRQRRVGTRAAEGQGGERPGPRPRARGWAAP